MCLHWAFLCPYKNKFGSLIVFTIILPKTNKTLYMHLKTDSKILGEIASLQHKILRLEALRALSPYEQCTFFFYSSSGKFLSLNENDLPFDLSFEVRILIDAALEHYQHEIKRLENSFQCDVN